MKIEQIYTGCIAQAAYYLESNGEAAIFDPLREVQPYIDKAAKDNAAIKYIFETHFHADFVSGHLDLARKTGAKIVYGPTAAPNFEAVIATDGQEFKVGHYTIKAIHTPGHTLESTCYLLIKENGTIHGIITGDTLFIGDVGRPDLAQALTEDLTQEVLASHLYDSLRNKIMPLPDDITVYPSHGAGSACGKNMSKETTDTLGNQKKVNYALRADMTKEEFIKELLDGLGAPPAYFPQNVMLNIQGYQSLDNVLEKGATALTAEAFQAKANETEALILDVRHEDDFCKEHIPGSIFIGLNGNFAPWVGALIMDVNQPIILVTPEGKEKEAITRLARVGFDNTLGYLKGGMPAWKAAGFETDLNNDGDAHLNQMDESDCYNEGRITLNDDNTFTYIYTAVLIDEAEGSIGCAEEITYTGTWELVSGTTSEAVIEITYEAGNGEDTSLLLAKTDNELVWTDDTLVSQYPDRDDEGAPVYTLGSTQFVYRK